MTVTRDAPPAGPAPPADPLARVGRQLIEAERRLRFRRARRRIAGGAATGLLLLVALAVALLPGGPLDGGGAREPAGVAAHAPAAGLRGAPRLRLDLRWGGSVDATVLERVRLRLVTAGYRTADVRGDGSRITVAGLSWMTRRGTHADQRRQLGALLGQGQLAIYDWEESVVDAGGSTIAGRTDAASERIGTMDGDPGAGMTLAQARAAARRADGPAVIVRALPKHGVPWPRENRRSRYYVLRGSPALTGADVERVDTAVLPGDRTALHYSFRDEAQEPFHALTRTISQRGQSLALPGASGSASFQHLAIVLDDRLLSVVAIDPLRRPDGLDGRRGLDAPMSHRRAVAVDAGLRAMGGGTLPPLSPVVFTAGGR
jgi:hypothetical protein